MSLAKRALAELIGTFWLVFGGCGAALLACNVPGTGIGYAGVALAFGLTVLTMAYAIGHISGCHLNPAVTLGLLAAGRFKGGKDTAAYIVAQIIGGILAAAVLFAILCPDLVGAVGGFATNGWSEAVDPTTGRNAFGGTVTGAGAAFAVEAVLTCFFLFVIIGATDRRAPAGLAPVAIGLCLTLIHLISIPVTNTSVNPARSIAVAVFNGGQSLAQLWLFIVAPIVGAVVAGAIYRFAFEKDETEKCCNPDCKCEKKCSDCKCEKAEAETETKAEA